MSATQKELLESVVEQLSEIKKDLPNGQFKILLNTVYDMKEDISDLKFTLLNPEDGVIVRTNKSLETINYLEREFDKLEAKTESLGELIKWKNTVTRALWILFSAIVAVIVQILSMTNAS